MDSQVERLQLLIAISRELTSTHALPIVLQRVLQRSLATTDAESGSILVLNAQGQPVEGVLLYGDQVYPDALTKLHATFTQGIAGWVAQHRQSVLIPDTRQDPRWEVRPDDQPDQRGGKSAIAVPLIAQDALVGILTITRALPRVFTPADLEMIQAIGDQAAIAILNARLVQETRRRNRLLAALLESALVIGQPIRTQEVLERILQQVQSVLNVEAASIALVRDQRKELVFEAATGLGAREIVGQRIPMGTGIAGWVAQHNQPLVVADVSQEPRFFAGMDRRIGFTTHAIACAPMVIGDQVIGVLEAVNPVEGRFADDTQALLSGIASLAALAVHRARLFDRIARAEQRYHDLFETSIDAILLTDWEGFIVEANRQARRLLNLPPGTVLTPLRALLPLPAETLGAHFEALKDGRTVHYETAISLPGGDRPVEVHARQVQVEDMYLIQWVLHDIQERKELDTLRDDLTAMIFHDLRSPLTNILTSLDVLSTSLNLDTQPTLRSLLQIAQRAAERIQRLTNSLLDMSRLEAGQPVRDRKAVSPAVLIRESVEAMQAIADSKAIHLQITTPDSLPAIFADEDMLRRVLINLLENALKYTPPDGQVEVGAAPEGEWVRFWVQDNGPGIPPEEQAHIFNKYARLRTAEKSRASGVGLGLAFCKLAVEGHGGQIGVISQPGQGARFHFTVPLATPEQIAAAEQAPTSSVERIPPLRTLSAASSPKQRGSRGTAPFTTEPPSSPSTNGTAPLAEP